MAEVRIQDTKILDLRFHNIETFSRVFVFLEYRLLLDRGSCLSQSFVCNVFSKVFVDFLYQKKNAGPAKWHIG